MNANQPMYYDDLEAIRNLPDQELLEMSAAALQWRRLRASIEAAGAPDLDPENLRIVAEALARYLPPCPWEDPSSWIRRAAGEWEAFSAPLKSVGLDFDRGIDAAKVLLGLVQIVGQDPAALKQLAYANLPLTRLQRNERDAAEWRTLLELLNHTGLHPEDEADPGASVARAVLRWRGEWQSRFVADPLLDGTDTRFADIKVHLLRTVDTVYGRTTVGYTDDGLLALVAQDRQAVYTFHFHVVAAELLRLAAAREAAAGADPAPAAETA